MAYLQTVTIIMLYGCYLEPSFKIYNINQTTNIHDLCDSKHIFLSISFLILIHRPGLIGLVADKTNKHETHIFKCRVAFFCRTLFGLREYEYINIGSAVGRRRTRIIMIIGSTARCVMFASIFMVEPQIVWCGDLWGVNTQINISDAFVLSR